MYNPHFGVGDFFFQINPLTIIPKSDWLPNVGFGQLEELWAAHLQHYAQKWYGMIIFYYPLTAGIRGMLLKEWLRNGLICMWVGVEMLSMLGRTKDTKWSSFSNLFQCHDLPLKKPVRTKDSKR